jgi:hypothetical protein
MNLAQLAVEILRRALFVPEVADERPDNAVAQLGVLAHERHDEEATAVRGVLDALLRSAHENDFSSATLDALTPETLRRLEGLLDGLLNGWYSTERLRSVLRPVLVESAK